MIVFLPEEGGWAGRAREDADGRAPDGLARPAEGAGGGRHAAAVQDHRGSSSSSDALTRPGHAARVLPGKADFSGIATGEPLALSAVIHKAYVDVNEKGTEAAAATAAIMRHESLRIEPKPVLFRADHPFFFVIRDNGTGSLLFAGRLVNPQTK